MSGIHRITAGFAVAGQLAPADMAQAAADGFKTIIKNRLEREEPGQPTEAEMKAAAEAAGLAFISLPFNGPPPPAIVAETAAVLERVQGPVLAYCRSGTRSIMAWAMAQALEGALRPDDIIGLAAKAGYDLAGARGALISLSPGS